MKTATNKNARTADSKAPPVRTSTKVAPLTQQAMAELAKRELSKDQQEEAAAFLGVKRHTRRATLSDPAVCELGASRLHDHLMQHVTANPEISLLRVEMRHSAAIQPIESPVMDRKGMTDRLAKILPYGGVIATVPQIVIPESDNRRHLAVFVRAIAAVEKQQLTACKKRVVDAFPGRNDVGLPIIRVGAIKLDDLSAATTWLFEHPSRALKVGRDDHGEVRTSKVDLAPIEALRLAELLSQAPFDRTIRGTGTMIKVAAAIRTQVAGFQRSRALSELLGSRRLDPWNLWASIPRSEEDKAFLPMRLDGAIADASKPTRRRKSTKQRPGMPPRPGSTKKKRSLK